MISWLKKHPFAVEAFFESSVVLTFAIPKEILAPMIPPCLVLDTFQDKWAFIAVAMVQTSGLRPKGFPKFMGNDFFLIGYRIFVRYHNNAGKRLRGLYILKSETNKKRMEILGSIFTQYKYDTIDIQQYNQEEHRIIQSTKANFRVNINPEIENTSLPEGSPFADWKEARRFAGPLPHTFTYQQADQQVLIIQGLRQNWKPQPISIASWQFEFLEQLNIGEPILANAFEIKNIPYQWKKGKIEKWQS